MSARRRARSVLALGCLAVVLAGCGGSGSDDDVPATPDDDASPTAEDVAPSAPDDVPSDEAEPSATPEPEAAPLVALEPADAPTCWPEGARAFRGGTEADPGTVVLLGDGALGIVLAPQASQTYCPWSRQAQRLADAGYLVASFSWTLDGTVAVRAAVQALQDAGADAYVLMGASKGGTYVAATADDLEPGPAGVIALGPPDSYGIDAQATASSYTGPLLVLAATDDSAVAVESSRLVARADEPDTFVELSGGDHGWALFDGEHAAEVEGLVDDFLAEAFGSPTG